MDTQDTIELLENQNNRWLALIKILNQKNKEELKKALEERDRRELSIENAYRKQLGMNLLEKSETSVLRHWLENSKKTTCEEPQVFNQKIKREKWQK